MNTKYIRGFSWRAWCQVINHDLLSPVSKFADNSATLLAMNKFSMVSPVYSSDPSRERQSEVGLAAVDKALICYDLLK